jgi:hypothetical protein
MSYRNAMRDLLNYASNDPLMIPVWTFPLEGIRSDGCGKHTEVSVSAAA